MATLGLARALTPLLIVGALSACDESAMSSNTEPTLTEDGTVLSGRTETRDVERPDIFSVTEQGLWDGRPSLGGVWVAHPDVTDPERALVTVSESGRKISGALFRRERNNPGPRIQVSSDAAAALGMLAGQPTTLEIVVLRTETVELPPTPEEIAAAEAAAAEAALAETAAGVEDAVGEAMENGDEAAAAGEGFIEPVEFKRRPFWQRFGRRTAAQPVEASAEAVATATGVATEAVESAPLDTVAAAAAAIDRAEAEAAAPAAAEIAPFLQVGLYSDRANADAATVNLRQAGLQTDVRPLTSDDGTLWRVLVGPISSVDDQRRIAAEVAALGYKDAFPTAN